MDTPQSYSPYKDEEISGVGFDAHEARRKQIQDGVTQAWANFGRATAGMAPEERNSQMKIFEKVLESRVNPEHLKPFEQTPNYTMAVERAKTLQDKNATAITLGSQLFTMNKLMDEGKKQDAIDLAKGGIAKTINSIISPDALAIGEIIFKAPSLTSAAQLNVLQNANPFSIRGWALKAFEQLGEDEFKKLRKDISSGKTSTVDAITGILKKASEADPDTFLKMGVNIYNSSAEGYNGQVDDIARRTSPMHASSMGARRLRTFEGKSPEEPAAAPAAPAPPTAFTPPMSSSTPAYAPEQQPAAPAPSQKIYGNSMFKVIR